MTFGYIMQICLLGLSIQWNRHLFLVVIFNYVIYEKQFSIMTCVVCAGAGGAGRGGEQRAGGGLPARGGASARPAAPAVHVRAGGARARARRPRRAQALHAQVGTPRLLLKKR